MEPADRDSAVALPVPPVTTDAAPRVRGAGAPAPAHFVTAGEQKFDRRTYRTLGYVTNALLSVLAVYWVERTHSGQKWMDGFIEKVKKTFPSVNPDTAKLLASKSFFLSGGFAVLLPMKWLENDKVRLVKKWNREIYGDAVGTDPVLIQSERELAAAPKQSWLSVMSSRVLALVPFYATVGLLWERESLLSKWTNPELRALSKEAVKTMKETDPQAFSQLASKGLYFDRPIGYVSRKLGKGWAKLTGNAEAVAQIEALEAHYPGTIRSARTPHGDHDPNHSAVPYYFISEAITSGMVAWGVYALTRVLGPLIGKKQPAAAEEVRPQHQMMAPVVAAPLSQELVTSFEKTLGDYGGRVVARARAHGVSIVSYNDKNSADGGHYDDSNNTIYLNTARPKERQAMVLVHESQHACNHREGVVLDRQASVPTGRDAYIKNRLQDEALAHAAGFIFANETKSQQELASPVMQQLFSGVHYDGASQSSFERYTAHAMAQLEKDALGYATQARESYEARTKRPGKVIALDDMHYQKLNSQPERFSYEAR